MQVDDLRSVIPFDCVPVAVELTPNAQRLERYQHPKRAMYVFGAEDGSLPPSVLAWCRDVVVIPAGCLNISAAVNVCLYARTAQMLLEGAEEVPGEKYRRLKVV